MEYKTIVEVLAGIIGVVVPAIITVLSLIFKNLIKYKTNFANAIQSLKTEIATLQAENYKLQNRVSFLEKENKLLKEENLKLKELRGAI